MLWSKDSINQVEIEFSDFLGDDNNIMPASIAQSRFVRYVITDEFADGCGHRKPEDYAASLSPDYSGSVWSFDMEPETPGRYGLRLIYRMQLPVFIHQL